MRNWFSRLKLSRQLALVSCLFLLIPMLLLCYTVLRGQHSSAIQSRVREAQGRCVQAQAQVQRTAELCNMSTQVYLNTPALTGHLALLKQGEEPGAAELLAFYRTTVASLEKITLSNPDLYQIRVYAEADGISEMMPILYSRARMEGQPWAASEPTSGSWQMDYDDCLFAGSPATPHIMSLVTAVTNPALGRIGTLEVAVRMEEVLPELFSPRAGAWTVLVDNEGALLAGETPVGPEELARLARTPDGEEYSLSGKRVLVTCSPLKEMGCVYLQVTDLSDLYRTLTFQFIYLLAVLLAAFAVMTWAVSLLTRRILRGFYGAFDGLRAFAGGDIDARVETEGRGEVADFARETGRLLDQLRRLMRDNLEREGQIQRTELRALQNQINAHFIYNVLEAIKMMAEIDIPLELMGQPIPKVSLQPIVENAVIHGAAALAADSTITLTGACDREGGRFTIRIADQGRGMGPEELERLRRQIAGEEPTRSSFGNGIGLKNVQDRIQMAYGSEYGLDVESQPGGGTAVTVTFPFHEATEGSL